MSVRPFVAEDIQPLKDILEATGVFRKEEVEVAVELMQIVVEEPEQRDYLMYTSVDGDRVRGYYCVGPTPMTVSTFDLYWIAVDPAQYGKKVGHELMDHCASMVSSLGGTKIIAETSSQASYDRTRSFYLKHGFQEEARIREYYSPGDDLIIYTKQLGGTLR